MPKGGSKPGERRGGRKRGTPNKSTVGRAKKMARARAEAESAAPPPDNVRQQDFDALDQLTTNAKLLITMAAREQQKGDKADSKWMVDLLDAVTKVCAIILPYQHRRLGQIGVDVEALMQRDGTLKVSIASSDGDL